MPKYIFQSTDSSKKQKTLGFQRLSTTTSAATSSNATTTTRGANSSSTASFLNPIERVSSSTSTIATTGGKENNIRDDDCGIIDISSDEEDDRELAAGRLRVSEDEEYCSKPTAYEQAMMEIKQTSNEDNVHGESVDRDDVIEICDTDEDEDRESPATLPATANNASRPHAATDTSNGRRSATANNASRPHSATDMSNGRWSAIANNASRPHAATHPSGRPSSSTAGHRTTPRTQSLLSPSATPVMKDRLDHGDLLPADEVQIENALTKASAIMKLATLPDKDFVYLKTAYGWILNIIQFTEPTKQEVKNVVMPITNACGDSMVTIGEAYVDGRFKRAEDIDDTYGPHTHRFGESRKCPIMVTGNAGVCAQVEQFIVDLQGDRATNQRREGIKANGKDSYGRVISRTKPGYIYYNICHDYIRNQEQYLAAKKNNKMKQTATRVWSKFGKYGLQKYIKRNTAEMAEGIPRSAEDDTDVLDVEEESTEAVEYGTMMAELDTAVEIVSDTLPIIDSSNDDVILDTLSDNLRPEIVDIIMDHPDGGMLDDAMGSLVQNWTTTGSARYSGLICERRSRVRGIITSITGEPLAAFKKIGRNLQSGQDTLVYLVGSFHPTGPQIKAAGVEGHPFANGHLRVRECFPADLSNYSSFDNMMMAWRNNQVKVQALRTAKELSVSEGNLRRGGNNGSIIISCAATFTGAVKVASGEYERTLDSLRRFQELLEGPSKAFHIAGGCNAKKLKLRLQDPHDRCEFVAIRKRNVGKLYPAFRMRYADEE